MNALSLGCFNYFYRSMVSLTRLMKFAAAVADTRNFSKSFKVGAFELRIPLHFSSFPKQTFLQLLQWPVKPDFGFMDQLKEPRIVFINCQKRKYRHVVNIHRNVIFSLNDRNCATKVASGMCHTKTFR